MPVPTVDLSGNNFTLELSRAQLGEVWGAESDAEGAALLARIAQIEDIDEEPRKAIWVDFMYQQLAFAKEQSLIASKALAFFEVMLKLHARAVESMAKKDGAVVGSESEGLSRDDGFQFFAEQLLAATKALPVPDRFTLLEAQAISQHVQSAYLQNIKLHQLVFTQRQTTRESEAQLFLQTPAMPPPLSDASDEPPSAEEAPASSQAAVPEAAAAAAAPEAAPVEEVPAEAPAALEDDGLGNAELTAAINKAVGLQVEGLQAQLAAEYASQEQALLDRIAKLEK
mmetsp:Transcript_9014/g.18195  ORF Transcript_9014/g.18195 Transcript_9014/m.18195 type:complete len:284 (+) Transcript_9014:18-869(+)